STLPRRLLLVGTLAGLAYNLDLGLGPPLLACLFLLVAWRCRRPAPVGLFVLSAGVWVLAHPALNYALCGVVKPMTAVAEYADWPGSPFSQENLTGFWRYNLPRLAVYALGMLFGKQGFVGHSLPLLLALPALGLLLWRRGPEWPEVAFGA